MNTSTASLGNWVYTKAVIAMNLRAFVKTPQFWQVMNYEIDNLLGFVESVGVFGKVGEFVIQRLLDLASLTNMSTQVSSVVPTLCPLCATDVVIVGLQNLAERINMHLFLQNISPQDNEALLKDTGNTLSYLYSLILVSMGN